MELEIAQEAMWQSQPKDPYILPAVEQNPQQEDEEEGNAIRIS